MITPAPGDIGSIRRVVQSDVALDLYSVEDSRWCCTVDSQSHFDNLYHAQ